MMADIMESPKFLSLALKAQSKMGASRRQGDSEYTEGLFCVLDMLDMLGKELDEEQEKGE